MFEKLERARIICARECVSFWRAHMRASTYVFMCSHLIIIVGSLPHTIVERDDG